MIVYWQWRDSKVPLDEPCAEWDAWFLFGFIPLYIRRRLVYP